MALHWWDDIKTEVKALHSEIVQGTQRSGSRKDRTAHTEQWKVLEKRMDEYASGLQGLISAQVNMILLSSSVAYHSCVYLSYSDKGKVLHLPSPPQQAGRHLVFRNMGLALLRTQTP